MTEPATESTRIALGGAEGPGLGEPGLRAPAGQRLRELAARGTVVNAAFLVGFSFLGFLKGFGVAGFITVKEYGVWGLLAVSLSTLLVLVQVGVDDQYIQQDDEDQEAAFQIAFTLQSGLCAVFAALIFAAMPLYALAYGDWQIVLPGYALTLAMPAIALQSPLWTFYRRMDFVTQRKLQAFDPVVGLVVTVVLAAAGFGYWALVVGMVCGAWAAAIAAVRASPYRLALRFEREILRKYVGFSGPLFLSALNGVLVAQVPMLVAQRSLGLAGVGAITIAATISAYAMRVDDIVTNTIYPAVCAVKDRADVLLESFLKSNRLALLWATPLGLGIVLFAPDLVHYVLGDRWQVAVFAIQAFGLTAALHQVGFNWSAFYRALGKTRPIATASVVMLASVLVIAVPLLLWKGVDGFGVGMGLATLNYVALRIFYLARLFPLRAVLVNTARGMAPTLPALALALAVRWLEGGGEREPVMALAEVMVFLVVAAGTTLVLERDLLREFRGYLRKESAAPPVAAA